MKYYCMTCGARVDPNIPAYKASYSASGGTGTGWCRGILCTQCGKDTYWDLAGNPPYLCSNCYTLLNSQAESGTLEMTINGITTKHACAWWSRTSSLSGKIGNGSSATLKKSVTHGQCYKLTCLGFKDANVQSIQF